MTRHVALSASLLAIGIAAGAFYAGRASSDEPPKEGAPAGMEEMMKEWAKMKTPGPQHEVLKVFEGSWLGTGSFTEQGMTSKFTESATATMIFDGRFLRIGARMTSEAAPGMPPMAMESLIFVGYDNAKQKYVHAMLGDWSTAVGTAEGAYDAATKTFTMTGVETLGAGKERKYRMVQHIVSNDEWTLEMYVTQPDGKETKSGAAVYKRK